MKMLQSIYVRWIFSKMLNVAQVVVTKQHTWEFEFDNNSKYLRWKYGWRFSTEFLGNKRTN